MCGTVSVTTGGWLSDASLYHLPKETGLYLQHRPLSRTTAIWHSCDTCFLPQGSTKHQSWDVDCGFSLRGQCQRMMKIKIKNSSGKNNHLNCQMTISLINIIISWPLNSIKSYFSDFKTPILKVIASFLPFKQSQNFYLTAAHFIKSSYWFKTLYGY